LFGWSPPPAFWIFLYVSISKFKIKSRKCQTLKCKDYAIYFIFFIGVESLRILPLAGQAVGQVIEGMDAGSPLSRRDKFCGNDKLYIYG
jgi:hypothetical protein